jgi:hypothetical protein
MLKKLKAFESNLVGSLKAAARHDGADEDDGAAATAEKEGEEEAREGGAGVTRFVSEGLYYGDDDDEDDSDWKSHSLKFSKEPRRGEYHASVDDYVVEDPLLMKGKEKFMASKAAKRMNEWAGQSLT